MKIRSRLRCIPLVIAAGCLDEGPALESQEQEVQAAFVGVHFDLARDSSLASRATGMLEVPIRDASGVPQTVPSRLRPPFPARYNVRGTCGVTFIAPHYAITATHCVDNVLVPDPATQQVLVHSYDITAVVEDWYLLFRGNVTGSYPNYAPITGLDEAADQTPGYRSDVTSCTVRARCAFLSSPGFNCTTGGDVALLYCPHRTSSAWLPVASSDPGTGPVDMYWFHEVLYMPTTDPGTAGTTQERDRFAHYTSISAPLELRKNNFHYLDSPTNAILPLKSRPWSDGTPRRRVGNGWTDMFACHGTSGSGVLQVNALGKHELLGPVSGASPSWGSTRLCTDGATLSPGIPNMSYTSNTSVRDLEAAFLLQLSRDRRPGALE